MYLNLQQLRKSEYVHFIYSVVLPADFHLIACSGKGKKDMSEPRKIYLLPRPQPAMPLLDGSSSCIIVSR